MKKVFSIFFLTLGILLINSCVPSNHEPSVPSNPNPENGATDVSINVILTWSASDPDGDPLRYDLYFGTDEDPSLAATNLLTPTYNPGPLEYSTTYYWKVVVKDDHGHMTEGPIWSFTTEEQPGFVLVNDDFESYTAGSEPNVPWGEYHHSGSAYAVISYVGNPGKSVRFVDPGWSNSVKITKSFEEFRKGALEIDLRLDDPHGFIGARFWYVDTWDKIGPYVGIGYFDGEDRLYVYAYDSYNLELVKLVEAEPGRWYRLKVVFDLEDSGDYEVYVDGALAGNGRTEVSKVNYFLVQTFSGVPCSEGYIDNLKITVYDEDY